MILAPSKREEKRGKWGDRMLDFITILPHGKGKTENANLEKQ